MEGRSANCRFLFGHHSFEGPYILRLFKAAVGKLIHWTYAMYVEVEGIRFKDFGSIFRV